VKILVVTNMYPTPRRPYFGIFVQRQVEALRREGVHVVVEVIAGERGRADYLLSRGRIAETIRREKPDLVHCHYGYTQLAVAFMGRPYVVTLCGDDINGESDGRGGTTLKSRIGVLITQALALKAARVIVKSQAMRARLWARLRERSDLVPNGVDESFFCPGPQEEARRRLGLPRNALVIAFVNSGRQPTKRLDLALATRDELRRRGHEVCLSVAEAVPAGEMPWYYRAADCLLLTSDREGSPNCVKEALACGVPVVGVPVGSVPEMIDTPERGRVAPRDPVLLANAVEGVSRARSPDASSLLPEPLRASSVARRLIAVYGRVRVERHSVRNVAAT